MSEPVSRRLFLAAAAAAVPGAAMSADDPKPTAFERDYPAPQFVPKLRNPRLPATLVQDFVIFAHSDLEMTKKLLAKEPKLAAATVDWGGGDWESGLGGAAHMGNRDIVEFLLANGARPDIFTAAMLGQLEVVKAQVTAYPPLIDAKGPHGFSLHFHAKAGGKPAEKVLAYLQGVKPVDLTPKASPKKG